MTTNAGPDADSPDGGWLTPEQVRDWASLMSVLMTLPGRLDAQLKQAAGINLFEYSVLTVLSETPGRTRVMSDLADQTRASLSRLSHAVSRLEAQGWVERRSCAGAGRRTEAILTDAGWHELQQIAPGHVREVRRLVVDAMSAEQFQSLGSAARRIVAATDSRAAADLAAAIERSQDR